MGITAIKRDFSDDPNIVRIETTNTLSEITTLNYLVTQQANIRALNHGNFEWISSDVTLITYADGEAFFKMDSDTQAFVALVSPYGDGVLTLTGNTGGVINPNSSGNITLTGASTGLTFAGSTNTLSLSGTLAVANGGTGNNTALTNGQLWIGNTGNPPSRSTLNQGAGISITNAAGSITISSSQSGLAWYTITSTLQGLFSDSGFIINSGSTCTLILPSTAFIGTSIYIVGRMGGWTVSQNTGQSILCSPGSTTVTTGSLSSASPTDTLHLICSVADTEWTVISQQSNGLIIV